MPITLMQYISFSILYIAMMTIGMGCVAQNDKKMKDQTNPLLCDPAAGACEIPQAANATNTTVTAIEKPVKVIYFTDPICSSCWGIEPQLRKLKLEYGNDVEIEYRMGGLLPDWSYNSGGISKPSDVAHHWDEVSAYYKMPIDGDVWLEDPLHSSYPPSIAFKAAQMQDEKKAIEFLRVIREMVFLEKKNITKWEHLADAAAKTNLDVLKLKQDYEGAAKESFQSDLDLARQMGVRGFPTLFVMNSEGTKQTVYGFKPYSDFENAIKSVYPKTEKLPYDKSWEGLFAKYSSLTAREFAELSDLSFEQSEQTLDKLSNNGQLTKVTTKNGALWRKK